MIQKSDHNWFETWFNSTYYHTLYKNRNEAEAELFIEKLCHFLNIPKHAKILDLACGKGRHAIQLNKKRFNVTGTDLSKASIDHASKYSKEDLNFFVNDMRDPFRTNHFDYIFNFFSSFGYFETDKEHINVLKNMSLGLKKDGLVTIDFMNVNKIMANLVTKEEKEIDGIKFKITKEIRDGIIIKKIAISDNGKELYFEEKVKIITLENFKYYLKNSGLEIINLLGNYDLNTFDELDSERLIIIAKKQ